MKTEATVLSCTHILFWNLNEDADVNLSLPE